MKNFLKRWFVVKPQLSDEQAARIEKWNALPDAEGTRIVVVDVETTGLDLARDVLISIGAVAVVNGRIELGENFSVVLQQDKASQRENILIHGISGKEQRDGVAPAEALLAFLDYLGKSPLVAFHAAFDETMIRRAMRLHLGLTFKHRWLDIAYVLPALGSETRLRTLDEWAEHFSIHNDERHNALADALATAQLLLVAVAKLREKQGAAGYDELCRIERRRRSAQESF